MTDIVHTSPQQLRNFAVSSLKSHPLAPVDPNALKSRKTMTDSENVSKVSSTSPASLINISEQCKDSGSCPKYTIEPENEDVTNESAIASFDSEGDTENVIRGISNNNDKQANSCITRPNLAECVGVVGFSPLRDFTQHCIEEKEEETGAAAAEYEQASEPSQLLSPCDSDSLDWRDETSPTVVPAKKKSKRRSSLFLNHQFPSRQLESLSPVKHSDSPASSPNQSPEKWTNEYEDSTLPGQNLDDTFIIMDEPSAVDPIASSAGFLTIDAEPFFYNEEEEDDEHNISPVHFVDEMLAVRDDNLLQIVDEEGDPKTIEEWKATCKRLHQQNQQLRKRLQSKLKSYDFQIGPFRYAFESVRTCTNAMVYFTNSAN